MIKAHPKFKIPTMRRTSRIFLKDLNKFICVHCGHSDQADLNAAKNLEFLGLAGVYGLRSLPSSE